MQQKTKKTIQFVLDGHHIYCNSIALIYGVCKTIIVKATQNVLHNAVNMFHKNSVIS